MSARKHRTLGNRGNLGICDFREFREFRDFREFRVFDLALEQGLPQGYKGLIVISL